LGIKYAYNSESPTFLQDIEAAIKRTSPSIIFECVGGSLPGVIFKLMAPKSHMVVYGNLSQEQVSFDVSFHTLDKLISGIRMPSWTSSLPAEELTKWL
jgi:NADPH:quinone reductase-like Zn-dependent oxidoreductase